MSDAVAARLRAANLMARTVSIKVRFGDFRTISRSHTVAASTASGTEVCRVAQQLLADVDVGRGVRLLGVATTGLAAGQHRQLTLDEATADDHGDWRLADEAVDKIRRRFGTTAIGPASLVEQDEGLQTRIRNENPWG